MQSVLAWPYDEAEFRAIAKRICELLRIEIVHVSYLQLW